MLLYKMGPGTEDQVAQAANLHKAEQYTILGSPASKMTIFVSVFLFRCKTPALIQSITTVFYNKNLNVCVAHSALWCEDV